MLWWVRIKTLLQPPYTGSLCVLHRNMHTVDILLNSKHSTVLLSSVKPAHMFQQMPASLTRFKKYVVHHSLWEASSLRHSEHTPFCSNHGGSYNNCYTYLFSLTLMCLHQLQVLLWHSLHTEERHLAWYKNMSVRALYFSWSFAVVFSEIIVFDQYMILCCNCMVTHVVFLRINPWVSFEVNSVQLKYSMGTFNYFITHQALHQVEADIPRIMNVDTLVMCSLCKTCVKGI